MKILQKHFKDIVRVTIAIFFALGLLSGASDGVWGFFDHISETWGVYLLLAVFAYATFVKRTTYINPQNGHKEHIDGWSFVLCLIFSCFYFAVKRAWRYFFGILVAVVVFTILTNSGMPRWLASLPIILPPFFLDMFMKGHYGRIGWMQESSAKEGGRNQEKKEYKTIHIPNITPGWALLAVLAFGFVLLLFGGGDRRGSPLSEESHYRRGFPLPEGSHLTKVSEDECATECSSICGAFQSDNRPHAVWETSGDCRRLCLSKAGYPECTINSLRIGVKHVCPDCVISRDRRAKEEPIAPLGAQSPPDPYKSAPSAQDSPARKPLPFEPGAARLPDSAPNRVMGDAEFCWKLCAAAGLAYMEQHGASAAEGESIAQECLRTNC